MEVDAARPSWSDFSDSSRDHKMQPLERAGEQPQAASPRKESAVDSGGDGRHPSCSKRYSAASYALTDSTVSCILTRFRVRSFWSMIPFYFAFKRVRKDASNLSGFLEAIFLVENLRTCYTLSLWKNGAAIAEFGSIKSHIDAANHAFYPVYRKDLNRPEIWSAQFRLWAVSCHNLNWEGLNVGDILDKGEREGEPISMEEAGSVRDSYAR
jgi:hypothetical protein